MFQYGLKTTVVIVPLKIGVRCLASACPTMTRMESTDFPDSRTRRARRQDVHKDVRGPVVASSATVQGSSRSAAGAPIGTLSAAIVTTSATPVA
jgi:hypothetical protein